MDAHSGLSHVCIQLLLLLDYVYVGLLPLLVPCEFLDLNVYFKDYFRFAFSYISVLCILKIVQMFITSLVGGTMRVGICEVVGEVFCRF